MKIKSDLIGIVTLSNNPLATFNIRREKEQRKSVFKQGDRVMCNDDGNTGTVSALEHGGCTVITEKKHG